MFRIISHNATQQGLKPSLISKIKNISLASSSQTTATTPASQPTPLYQFNRQNSNIASSIPQINNQIKDGESPIKHHYKPHRISTYTNKEWNKTIKNERVVEDEYIKSFLKLLDKEPALVKKEDLYHYSNNLFTTALNLRRNRLSGSRNRDKDDFRGDKDDILVQKALLHLTEVIADGKLNHILSPHSLFKIFSTLLQYSLDNEIINLWEQGVSLPDEKIGKYYLSHQVLSVVIQVAYKSKKFQYDEIKSIYDMSTNESDQIHPFLIDQMGQIAISEGDYNRGLDAIETLMNSYEKTPGFTPILGGLAQLHLSFIGNCKDLSISKRFFEKALNSTQGLPYLVTLKAPYMVQFLKNCEEQGDSFDEILNLWTRIAKDYYDNEKDMTAKIASVNNAFFKIFFKRFPEINDEALEQLKIIFQKTPKIDQVFLNTLISQFSYHDKELFEDILTSYDRFDVPKSLVTERIVLKKAGEIDFSVEEILNKWNNVLKTLDSEGMTYIANADWSAIRQATVLSETQKSSERDGLYYSIVKAYKNYMQNDDAALKSLRMWIKIPDIYKVMSTITSEEDPIIENEVQIIKPQFKNLRENINYRAVTKKIVDSKPRLLE
ncbi:unnamed protein product [Candida verbasci]|uniref:Uncharacterized protein n=1 Tax=Candida verbasci TaxID=1227364 RepID=A0A9W4XAC1_9ASCO|nr:unnamed protein product [Candida verbasci]